MRRWVGSRKRFSEPLPSENCERCCSKADDETGEPEFVDANSPGWGSLGVVRSGIVSSPETDSRFRCFVYELL